MKQHPLKGKPKSKDHIAASRRGLLRYFAKYGSYPCPYKGLRAWDVYHIAYQAFRSRGISEQESTMAAKQMFWLPTSDMRKAYFELTKQQGSPYYLKSTRHMSEAQKHHLSVVNTGKILGPQSDERKEKGRRAALRNLRSGKTKPSANSIKGYFFSKKNGTKFRYKSSWELEFMKAMEKADNVVSYSVEPFCITYVFNGREHLYFPDYEVKVKGRARRRMVEVKPKGMLRDGQVKAKLSALQLYCKKQAKKFVLITEKELFGGGSPTTGLC